MREKETEPGGRRSVPEMAENGEHRDNDNNNWVIPNTEGLPVETLGHELGAPRAGHEEPKPEGPEPAATAPEPEETRGPEVTEPKGPETPPPITEIPPHQEPLEIPPEEEPQSLGEEPSLGLRRRLGGDLEEVSCSSSEDDVEGLRKRAQRGAPPTTSVGPSPREAEQAEEDAGFSLTLNKCIIAAVALMALAVLAFTGGLGGEDDLPQTVITRSARGGDKRPETIADIKEWLHQHADQFTADPDALQVMNDLLDKVAKENQEIRHIQATFQAQKEDLEALVHGTDTATPESPNYRLTEENVRLKEALLREETGHLFAKEELQNLQEKMETLEGDNVDKEVLTTENTQLKADLEASKSHIEGFLTQKETLVAESQMLRQELDKQRSLVASIRQELDGLVANATAAEEEKDFQGRLSEMSNRLAMEAQRSETWEKTYVEHAQRRKELVGDVRKPKEWKKGSKASESGHGEQHRKPHFKHGKEHGRRWTEDGHVESQHEEWKSKKYEDKPWREKRSRQGDGERSGPGEHPRDSDKGKENRWKDSSHSRHHHGDAGDSFHPRKGQKEFSESHKHGEDRRHGDKAHGKEHRHHDHNKFWKKLSDHQYRVPEGCSGLEDCARKDGVDLFNVDLKPVQRKRFEEVLHTYLNKSDLSKHLPELVPLLDGFFEGPHFAHHKIRFKDFVDDVEDFLEDLAKRETGSDDVVDDFERFVYTSFFGDAAIKKRSL